MYKFLILIVNLFAFACGFCTNGTFEQFIKHYNINIDFGEYEFRKTIYVQEQSRIFAHNKDNKGWKETLNSMSIMTKQERKKFLGYSKSVYVSHKPTYQTNLINSNYITNITILPEHVDWRQKGIVTAVKSQGSCGSCWAFASTAVIESHVAINTNKLFDLSVQQIATCTSNPDQCGGSGNCQGATAELAFDYVASSSGLYDEFELPYSEYYGIESSCVIPNITPKVKITGFVKLEENNYEQLMDAVANYGPIAISVDASSWHAYSSGIFDGCNQLNPDINHAVVLVGYGTDSIVNQDYWLVRNSWSASWGESGYIRLARKKGFAESESCGLDVTPQDGTACSGQTEPVKVCGTCGILYDSSYPIGATTI